MPTIQATDRKNKTIVDVLVDSDDYQRLRKYTYFVDGQGKVFREFPHPDKKNAFLRMPLAREVSGCNYNDSRTVYFKTANYANCKKSNLRMGSSRSNPSRTKSSAGNFWPITWSRFLKFTEKRDLTLYNVLIDALDVKYKYKEISITFIPEDYDNFIEKRYTAKFKTFLDKTFDWKNTLNIIKNATANYTKVELPVKRKKKKTVENTQDAQDTLDKLTTDLLSPADIPALPAICKVGASDINEPTKALDETKANTALKNLVPPPLVTELQEQDMSQAENVEFSGAIKKALYALDYKSIQYLLQDNRLFPTEDLIQTLKNRGANLVQWGN